MATRPWFPRFFFLADTVYNSRVVKDGYTIDDVLDQITSGMAAAAVVFHTPMTGMENPNPRPDRYGNLVRDRVVLECSARHPRPELFSAIPKGDYQKPKRPPTE